jgi:ectoine hydroxylase-related dioxygenase (phytanoyl-CoA dioxygenase family)
MNLCARLSQRVDQGKTRAHDEVMDAGAMERDGYVVVPQVLDAGEVARLRDLANASVDRIGHPFSKGHVVPNAAAREPGLSWLVAHDVLLQHVRDGLESEEVWFAMEADLHRNVVSPNWHKDSGEQVMPGGYFDCDAIGTPACRVVKVAFYLQDHFDGSGLWVRPGSHRHRALDVGNEQPVATRAGDAIVFDVRLTHRGKTASVADRVVSASGRLVPASRRGAAVEGARRAINTARRRPDRIAVYLAYGLPNQHTANFTRRNMERQLRQTADAGAEPAPEVRDALCRAGVRVASEIAPSTATR